MISLRYYYRVRVNILLLASMVLIGCSGEEVPTLVAVQGKVSQDGVGVTAGSIYFHPEAGASYTKDKPSSILQKDGSFTMKTFPFGEGVAPGRYKVTLATELAVRLNKPEYGNPDETPWEINIPAAGQSDLDFKVE